MTEQELPELDVNVEDCREQAENPKPAIAALRCRERQLLAALASLAQSEAERERLQRELAENHELFKATFGLATENANKLARERELNQTARQLLREYREFHINSRRPCVESATCSTCQEADALLEDKAKPVSD